MVLNWGIDPFHGNIGFYESETCKYQEFNIIEVDQNEIDKVEKMFEIIKSKNNNKFGNACICLDSGYGNEIRKKFIKAGMDARFEGVEIIDRNTCLYCETICENKNMLKSGEIVWIFYSNACYIWQKNFKTAEFLYRCDQAPKKLLSFLKENCQNAAAAKMPNFICNRSDAIDINQLKDIFPKCTIFNANVLPNWAKGATVKAEIMANNCNFKEFNATTVLGQPLTVIYGNDEIFSLPFSTSLPLNRSIILQKSDEENVLKVKRCETYYNTVLPQCTQFNFEISVDTNGIHKIEITSLNNLIKASSSSKNLTWCIGVDPKKAEITAYNMTSGETKITTIFNKSNKIDENIEKVFQKLSNIYPFEMNRTTVIHIDDNCFNSILIKLIRASQKYNIGNISFISTQTAELLNIFHHHQELITNNVKTVAHICDRFAQRKLYCQIWKRHGNCFRAEKSYFRDSDCGDNEINLEKLKVDSNSLADIDLIFFDSFIDAFTINSYFPDITFFQTDYCPFHSTAAMIKSRIIANDANLNVLNVENNLNRRITFFINNEMTSNFPLGRLLPFKMISDSTTVSTFKICERNAGGMKQETEYNFTENQTKTFVLHCDINGIFYLKVFPNNF
uniref:Uncharacterized protein n=1 Tax=Panagrolaimus superbus TaxID=310955 RepID=A0A914YUG6_9BILA